jgi:hypothetical protein
VRTPSERRFGAATVVGGASLLVIYAGLFPFVLPIRHGQIDYVTIVSSAWWVPLTGMAMAGVLFLLVGLGSLRCPSTCCVSPDSTDTSSA